MFSSNRKAPALLGLLAGLLAVAGCGDQKPPAKDKAAAVASERAKLPAEELALVEAQEWCVVANAERLGSMGPPLKLDIKGQPVFICCKSCQRKAEADPDKTLAKVAELKAKAGAEKEPK